tara:strand:- start:45 stop:482 length:438 start_codon:yes stop_codon:yes gene_type:complete
MSSLFTDTIRKTGGTAGTDIKINNSSTYVDGSNKSQNMVAAISKFWLNFSMAGTTARSDSLNNSSITDHETGDFSLHFTNNFNYEGYCVTQSVGGHATTDGHWDYDGSTYNQGSATLRVRAFTQGSSISLRDAVGNNWSAKGDLA